MLTYVYYEDEPGRRSAAKLFSKDKSWRITANIAKLPGPASGPACRLVRFWIIFGRDRSHGLGRIGCD